MSNSRLESLKFDGYRTSAKDFAVEEELTVTITLSEYRELVSSHATKTADIDKANTDKWTRDAENARLRKENEELKAKLYTYREAFGEINEEEEVENE